MLDEPGGGRCAILAWLESFSHVPPGAPVRLLVVERRHRNGGMAFPIELDAHEPGPAADLAVLDILLDRAAARIDQQLARLPAVWAGDPRHIVKLGTQIAVGRTVRFENVEVHATRCRPIPPRASFAERWPPLPAV